MNGLLLLVGGLLLLVLISNIVSRNWWGLALCIVALALMFYGTEF